MALSTRQTCAGGIIRLEVAGELAYPATESLLATVREAAAGDVISIQVNLAAVEDIASNSIYFFLEAWEACQARGIAFLVETPSPRVREFLAGARLDRVIRVV